MKFLINHIKQQYHIKDYKFGLIISVVAISVIGIMMVGSAKRIYDKTDHGGDPWVRSNGCCLFDRL